MKNKFVTPIFIFLLVLQLLVPAYLVFQKEIILQSGQMFKFKCMPMDPYNPLIGRYLTVNTEISSKNVENVSEYKNGDEVYITLIKDSSGFDKINSILKTKPVQSNYLKTTVSYSDEYAKIVHFNIPFNKYYMDEKKAPNAEKLLARVPGESNPEVFVTVKIFNGAAVIENLFVSGMKIEDYLRNIK